MNTSRVPLILVLICLLAPLAHAQASRTVNRSFDLATTGVVALDTYNGRVRVETWDRSRARVEVTIEDNDQTTVDQTRIRFDADADRLEIETDYDEIEDSQKLFGLFRVGSIDRPATDYTLTIPRTADLAVDTYSAATTVEQLTGDLTFDGYSAPLTIERINGALRADTYSGNIEVDQIEGMILADTYSGRLQADSVAGPVEFSTYSGSAMLGFVALTDDCQLNSFSGDVTATLPAGSGAIIETSEDALETELPVQIEQVGDDRIRAIVGDGGPRLRFDTFSGTLSVRSR